MANKFKPRDVTGTARVQLAPAAGYAVNLNVIGDTRSFNAEAPASGAGAVTFAEAVRTLQVYCQADCYVATSAAALGAAGDGKADDRRFFVPAKTWRELPWYQDEVYYNAPNTVILEGRQ